MSVGFILLTHQAPEATARLARHLAGQGAPVIIHLDRRARCGAALQAALDGVAPVISTRASEWGRIGLALATLDAAGRLLADHPGISHVYLLSAACLPLRPVAELEAFLEAAGERDFIEALPPDDWITGGLGEERFTLYHPVSWQRRRWLFDRLVDWQRWLGVRRRLPDDLAPHLGRQWWCLRASTLRQLLDHPALPSWKRFFRWVWIPDEAFFQTLVARLVPEAARDARALTLARFDRAGNPLVFHDDHVPLLAQTDHFFVRKADPEAAGLADWAFAREGSGQGSFSGLAPDWLPDADQPSRLTGLQMAGRFPWWTDDKHPDMARPYLVFMGEDAELLSASTRLIARARPDWAVHGRLFGPQGAGFAAHGQIFAGNLDATPRLRDYRPEQFLQRLIWRDRDRVTVFAIHLEDTPRLRNFVLGDEQARIVRVTQGGDMTVTVEMGNWERTALAEWISIKLDSERLAEEVRTGGRALVNELISVLEGTNG
ncbi:MAG: beta-1,6-N-acetylglucosaminyltransferase [Pseudomonadota bacterium]